jgi:hypothetical protein
MSEPGGLPTREDLERLSLHGMVGDLRMAYASTRDLLTRLRKKPSSSDAPTARLDRVSEKCQVSDLGRTKNDRSDMGDRLNSGVDPNEEWFASVTSPAAYRTDPGTV